MRKRSFKTLRRRVFEALERFPGFDGYAIQWRREKALARKLRNMELQGLIFWDADEWVWRDSRTNECVWGY